MRNKFVAKLFLAISAGVLLFPIMAKAACTLPSGSYAGAGAGTDYVNGAGVTGTSFPQNTQYQTSALTITTFPTTTTAGTFKLTQNISTTPPIDNTHNSIQSVSGAASAITFYDATTCSGEFTMSGNASVRPVNCNFNTTVAPPVMTCTLGASQVTPFKMRVRFTSSQAGNRVTLTPLGIFSPDVFALSVEMWRQ